MFAVVMIALLVGLLIFYTEFAPNGNVRMVLVLAGVGTISVRAALLLRRHAKPERARSFRFAEFVFWATGIVAAVRVAGMPFFHTEYVLEVHAANTLPVLFYTAFVVAGTLGVMWMEIELLQAKLMRSARTDALTGLLNRGGFEQEFDRALYAAKDAGRNRVLGASAQATG
jgi:predicted signal transduction protein with EAL and GGDEF domain